MYIFSVFHVDPINKVHHTILDSFCISFLSSHSSCRGLFGFAGTQMPTFTSVLTCILIICALLYWAFSDAAYPPPCFARSSSNRGPSSLLHQSPSSCGQPPSPLSGLRSFFLLQSLRKKTFGQLFTLLAPLHLLVSSLHLSVFLSSLSRHLS